MFSKELQETVGSYPQFLASILDELEKVGTNPNQESLVGLKKEIYNEMARTHNFSLEFKQEILSDLILVSEFDPQARFKE